MIPNLPFSSEKAHYSKGGFRYLSTKLKSYLFPSVLFVFVLGLAVYFVYRSLSSESALPIVKAAPDFVLQNIDNTLMTASVNKGKVVLMEFMFTSCPDICPLTTYKMVQLQEQLKQKNMFGNQVRFVAVTFDPERDTPEVLRDYAQRMNMDSSGWYILRGEEEQTKKIAAEYGIMVQNLGDGQFVHTVTSLNLIDSEQRIRKVYAMGEEMNSEEIMKDIESLLAEQSKSDSNG
ncbi:SCO family protein [Cohnella cholangitidis]|uniref:SCO family protein n=1 Tax=Cohnella cholangitidis TaxID=2598458 RepID=A0A7G5BS38_9BACL|nr:SCO family protein [Cohnella cholangitidis]